jgi:molybdate transport system regulatory protein
MRTSKKNIEVAGTVSLKKTDKEFLGDDRIALLEKIDEFGSITKAAKAVGISYKTAWDTIEAINNLSERPLFIRVTGGKSGGGTRLTEEGKEVIQKYKIVQEEHEKFLRNLEYKMGDVNSLYKFINRLSKKASTRNTFAGKITKIAKGGVKSEVTLLMKGGDSIVAMVTNENVDNLGLQVGKDVYAVIKSSSVIIGAGQEEIKVSISNKLRGEIVRLAQDAVNTELVVEVSGGNTISAVITNECATSLELKEGNKVFAMFNASSVILGVD